MLAKIVEMNTLIVANGLADKCQGLITMKRTTEDGVEESIIDFVIVSTGLVCDLKIVIPTSDHYVILTKFKLG